MPSADIRVSLSVVFKDMPSHPQADTKETITPGAAFQRFPVLKPQRPLLEAGMDANAWGNNLGIPCAEITARLLFEAGAGR